ncbi:hypothetical protein [Streptomyces sp. NBC_01198]|uniref:hypothetical protein n=1 Tax=Streptomyces sp. NBC_01198 TaxID=2903769 RepID=UPI002E104276|nr:hypothetical protein OG702_19635 [Streptomyces sp. NBC_01198]
MRVREAKARVGRDPSEPPGTARAEVIEPPRGRPGAEAAAQPSPAVGTEGFCRNCDQAVKPVVRNVWGRTALLVATTQLVAVIVSVVACFTPVDPWNGLRARIVTWPAAIHPVGLGVAAAVVAASATAWFADFLHERAERTASCATCRSAGARAGS